VTKVRNIGEEPGREIAASNGARKIFGRRESQLKEEFMDVRQVYVAAVQMAPKIGAVEENIQRAEAFIDQAAVKGAKIVCLPELFNTGYFCHYGQADKTLFQLAEPIPGPTTNQLGIKAKDHNLHIIAPIFERAAVGYYHNSAAVIDPKGKIVGKFQKVHIPWSAWGWEKYYFRPGYSFPVFKTDIGNIGIMICYDRFFPESARLLALQGAEIVFCPAGAPLALGDSWELVLRTRALENQLFVVGAGLTGGVVGEQEVTGRSVVINPQGDILAQLGRDEGVLVLPIDLEEIRQARLSRFDHRDRRPEAYGLLTKTSQD
jgi:predicted amidohydrolase